MNPARSLLALALVAALAGCMSKSEDDSTATATAPGDDAMASDAAMSGDAAMAADDNMGSDAMAGDAMMGADLAPARYQITFSSRWTENDHPLEYPGPKFAGLSVAHFSPIIGASHKPGFALFAEGTAPSAGLESLSETGKHVPLDAEINTAMTLGTVLSLVESAEPLKDHGKTLMAEVPVDGMHPQVSLVAMIAPSPDWFAGVKDVNLVENGQWVAEKTVDLLPYDSGGDEGTTYRADDADNDPKKPTSSLAGNPHFTVNGQLLP
ncbi:MAG: spondin domain-containing protein, partial [Arenimonas sp.]